MDFVHNTRDCINSSEHQIQHLRQNLNEHGMAINRLQCAQYLCPFIDDYENPVVKVVIQLLNVDRKYVVSACVCFIIGFLAIIIIISLIVVSLIS